MLNEIEKVRSSSEVQTKYLPRKQGKRIWPMSELAAISAHQIKRQLYCQLLYCRHIYVRFYHDSSSFLITTTSSVMQSRMNDIFLM